MVAEICAERAVAFEIGEQLVAAHFVETDESSGFADDREDVDVGGEEPGALACRGEAGAWGADDDADRAAQGSVFGVELADVGADPDIACSAGGGAGVFVDVDADDVEAGDAEDGLQALCPATGPVVSADTVSHAGRVAWREAGPLRVCRVAAIQRVPFSCTTA
ncbi:hypothetical protein OG217_05455 [Streptomyces sp. NBC_01023]|uniref:hypothetical protein n=1 Tax=Streptomyces sp. NBC_01023 TaxID=2903724 RepID=UPI003864D7A6|nr:hypothetical protein OG217_05455 [Streptomyces sp. NBC_01023]